MSGSTERFVSGDWGTSRLRLRLVDADSLDSIAEVESDDGIGPTFRRWQEAGEPAEREGFYLRAIAPAVDRLRAASGADLSGLTLVLSGMASSSIGLRELPYATAPLPMSARSLPVSRIESAALPCPVRLVSGVRTDSDVMRGEETILLGLVAGGLADGLVILPGTHSKHAVIRGGILETFHTYLTGELFAIIREHSVLRPSLSPTPTPGDAFVRGVRDASGANLLGELFALRARSVLQGVSPEENADRLSGLLIGTELGGLSVPGAAELPIVVAAPEPIGSFYRSALETLGLGPRCRTLPPEEASRAVVRAHRAILEAGPGG
ncbi:2-dehydro-3-deoxygalactonokinase [Tautonia sociabilis]|uniref:2-dehydro-3-deoxygalactonokinase n=1 Tax=Tautonia sociabilis TaxID=2080755 RepID=A0A432MMJ8_9BACT|nr:2-dehydro-3-deoxygalactonokinase [Tautonia sociabilis]RUL88663.1 2-dehydro-3-deoxygalactonokinase [Tautonia sociabilis]